ncbi:putative acid proteinase [Podospora fimiseda]|uniref:Acid proteinase n=1 Tax=Podospora fimiseda TaxID=252190 RepID=A0AAN7BSG3_9PEZI|nr:putative acid proteinase [Podospora fimiseda]
MKSPTYLITASLLFTLGLATPTTTLSKTPTRSNDGQQYQLRLLHTSTPSSPSSFRTTSSRIGIASQQQESTKGGALLTSDDATSSFKQIQTTFLIPQAKIPTRGPTANQTTILYASSFHIGIDSFSLLCPSGFLRAGVDIFYDGTLGDPSLQKPQAWYQLYPSDPSVFPNFTVAEGETVRVTVGNTEVKIENFGLNVTCVNGKIPKQVSTVKIDGKGVCGKEAGWIVEDFPLAGLPGIPVALADFGSVRFGGVSVKSGGEEGGIEKNAEGATVSDIWVEAQGGRLTSCEVGMEGGEVRCDRVFE